VTAVSVLAAAPRGAAAQGGPPYLTNDPGTPGHAAWEINVGLAPSVAQGQVLYQIPQLDVNFGLGERLQLSVQIPYTVRTAPGAPAQAGWSNALAGAKWRFWDRGEGGWQLSTFPQIETGGSALAQAKGVAAPGPRFLVPLEATKGLGRLHVDLEVGYYFPWQGPDERFLGIVGGESLNPRLELDAEVYDDRAIEAQPQNTTVDVGGRVKLRRGFVLLVMAGRAFGRASSVPPEFEGYVGIQILLSDYGRSLTTER